MFKVDVDMSRTSNASSIDYQLPQQRSLYYVGRTARIKSAVAGRPIDKATGSYLPFHLPHVADADAEMS